MAVFFGVLKISKYPDRYKNQDRRGDERRDDLCLRWEWEYHLR